MANYQNIIPFKLAQAEITTSYADIYTVPTSQPTRTIVKEMDVINTSSAAIGLYISFVPEGDSAGAENALFYNNSVPAYTTMQWCGSQVLNSGDFISVKASATGCTITVSGGEGT